MEDEQNGDAKKEGRQPKWKMTKWKATKMEDNQNERQPKWKPTNITTTSMFERILKKMHNSGKCLKLGDPPISLWEQN